MNNSAAHHTQNITTVRGIMESIPLKIMTDIYNMQEKTWVQK